MDSSPSEAGQSTQQRTRRQLPSMCRDYNRREGCAHSDCQELHLCSYFLINRCTDKRCAKAHALETPRNILLLERLGWSGPGDMAIALDIIRRRARGQVVSVCVMYNMGTCSASSCARLHICYRHVLDTCPLDDCDLSHDLLDGGRNADLLSSAGLTDTPVPELLRRLQEQVRRRPPQPAICRSVYGRQGCQRHCLRLHFCESLLNNRCRFGGRCTRSHSLKDPHNQRVLTFFGWTEEQVLRELKMDNRDRSVSLAARAQIPTEDDEKKPDQPALCEGSESGTGVETRVKKIVSAEEQVRQVSDSLQAPVKNTERYHQVCVQRARHRPQKAQQSSDEQREKERQEWLRKEMEWQTKDAEWQEKEMEWHNKEVEWQKKEKEWLDRQLGEQEKQRIEERARKEADALQSVENERKRMKHEQEKQDHLKAMAEKELREMELLHKYTQLSNAHASSEKTMSTIQQMNADLQQQIVSLDALTQKLENERQALERKLKEEIDGQKKSLEELSKLQEQEKKQRGHVECSICLGIFVEPVTLECAHTFCKACIDNTPQREARLPAMPAEWREMYAPMNYYGAPNRSRRCALCRRATNVQVPSLALKNIADCFSNARRANAPQQLPPSPTTGGLVCAGIAPPPHPA